MLSPRWVMWQETPAAGIVNRSSLGNCAVQEPVGEKIATTKNQSVAVHLRVRNKPHLVDSPFHGFYFRQALRLSRISSTHFPAWEPDPSGHLLRGKIRAATVRERFPRAIDSQHNCRSGPL